jgi:hypothetical protein
MLGCRVRGCSGTEARRGGGDTEIWIYQNRMHRQVHSWGCLVKTVCDVPASCSADGWRQLQPRSARRCHGRTATTTNPTPVLHRDSLICNFQANHREQDLPPTKTFTEPSRNEYNLNTTANMLLDEDPAAVRPPNTTRALSAAH